MEVVEDIVIIGAGIAGLTTSLGLHKLGIRSLVLESSEGLRITGYALTLWSNAWKALDAVGIGDSLRCRHQLLDGNVTTSIVSGLKISDISFNVKGKHGVNEVRRVKRNMLVEALAKELRSGTIRYSSKVVCIEESGFYKLVHLADGTTFKTKVLIGCDGVNSVVAKWLGLKKLSSTGRFAIRGCVDFKSSHGFAPITMHFFGNGVRFGFVPCDDNFVYWFFTWIPSSQEKDQTEDNPVKMKQLVLSKLGKIPDEVRAVVENTELDSFVPYPLRYRQPWELLWGNISKENVCVAGDALHPMTPDIGQGGCAALEDGVVLARCLAEALLKEHGGETKEKDDRRSEREEYERIEMGLKKFAKERKWRSIELISTAYIVGFMEQSDGKVMTFLRDKIFAAFLAGIMLKMGSFDCGKLILKSTSTYMQKKEKRHIKIISQNIMEGVAEDIVIVGAGIAGLTTSLGLHRLGIRSLVLESSDSLRTTGFAFTTWTNAWKALDAVGLASSLRQHHQRLLENVTTSTISGLQTSKISFEAKGKHAEHEVRCVKRKLLLEALAEELPSGTIRYSSKVVSLEESGSLMLVHLADGTILRAKVLIGCDGVNSVVAKWLHFKKPAFAGRSAIRGFADFKRNHGFENKFMQFFGKGFRSGFLPCDDSKVYWFFTWTPSSQDKEIEDNPARMKQFVLGKLEKVPDEIRNVIENTELDGMTSSALRYRHPWELFWGNVSKGNVCVAGDALHPMTPDLGQGGCSALEDGVVLARCLGQTLLKRPSGDQRKDKTERERDHDEYKRIELGLKKYAKERKWRSINLITTAYIIGYIQDGSGKARSFLRDKILARFLAGLLLKRADFDCGKLV